MGLAWAPITPRLSVSAPAAIALAALTSRRLDNISLPFFPCLGSLRPGLSGSRADSRVPHPDGYAGACARRPSVASGCATFKQLPVRRRELWGARAAAAVPPGRAGLGRSRGRGAPAREGGPRASRGRGANGRRVLAALAPPGLPPPRITLASDEDRGARLSKRRQVLARQPLGGLARGSRARARGRHARSQRAAHRVERAGFDADRHRRRRPLRA